MRGLQFTLAAVLAVAASAGCSSASKRSMPASEPGLAASTTEPSVSAVETPGVARSATVVSRHPLFSKPKQYYDSTNNNKVVKTAAATFVGVPVGLFGELKQIVAGNPDAASSAR